MARGAAKVTSADEKPVTPAPAALLAGIALGAALVAGAGPDRSIVPYLALAVGLAVAVVRPLRTRANAAVARLRAPSTKAKAITAAALIGVAGRYFMLSASRAGREFQPGVHDEFMNLLQARMLAHGRLWMPAHPLADFFDSFNILVKPVYASIYFPGTALLYVPGDWIGAAPWVTSVLVTAGAVAVLYLVVTELIDGVAGLLAAVLLIALPVVRTMAIAPMSHPAMLLLTLLATLAYVHWRRRPAGPRGVALAAAFGAACGWAAITRPLDAICLLAPIGLAFAWDLRRVSPRGAALRSIAAVVLAASPFLALQLGFDRGVTGHWLQTPAGLYDQENFPGLDLGFRPRTLPERSPSPLPQLRQHYEQFFRKPLSEHGRHGFLQTFVAERLEPTANASLPAHLLYALLPLAFLGRGGGSGDRTGPRWAAAAGALTLPLAYTFFPIYLNHYGMVCAASFIVLVLLGGEVLRASGAGGAFAIGVLVLCVGTLPEVRRVPDPYLHTPFLDDINMKLATLEHRPAVVLFAYTGHTDVLEEPVYNVDVAWPDDAPVVRAQDRGDDDRRIFAYYAARQPERFFYLYDRATAELRPLGWAKDLAARGTAP